ncbi:MAG: Gfo/Idh/MocA family oxidoreductase [Bacillota bacterium]
MEIKRVVRVGIVGCGGIAWGKHMPSLAEVENVQMVGFCDLEEGKAKSASEKYGAEGAKYYTDYKELLKDESIEVVHVLTPNSSHSEISVAALEAGKHVMCEKPMAISYVDGLKMVEAAKRTGKKLTIGYQNRFRVDTLLLHEICENDELGEVYFAKAHAIRRRAVPTWGVFLKAKEQGGGPLIDIGTHALDLTLWFMKNYKPKYVVGNSYRKLAEQENQGNEWGKWDTKEFTVEDSAFGFVTMENGATVVIEASWALNTLQTGEAMTTLCGTKGGADMADGLRINRIDHDSRMTLMPTPPGKEVDFFGKKKDNPALTEAISWINAIVNDTEPVVKPEEALAVTQILEAIYESSKTGKPVYFN